MCIYKNVHLQAVNKMRISIAELPKVVTKYAGTTYEVRFRQHENGAGTAENGDKNCGSKNFDISRKKVTRGGLLVISTFFDFFF